MRSDRSRQQEPRRRAGGVPQAILDQALEHFGCALQDLIEAPRGDLRLPAVAWALARPSTATLARIAECLQLGSPASISQRVRCFDAIEDRELPEEIRRWKGLDHGG